MPENAPSPLPAQCALDRSKLDHIAVTVAKISNQLDELTSMEGPISRIQQRLAIVEHASARAHERIDIVESQQKDDHDTITRWVAFAAIGASFIATGLNALLQWILR